ARPRARLRPRLAAGDRGARLRLADRPRAGLRRRGAARPGWLSNPSTPTSGRPAAGVADRFVGVDVGTTGARAVVFDREGRSLGEAAREYHLYTPRPSWAEQDPLE